MADESTPEVKKIEAAIAASTEKLMDVVQKSDGEIKALGATTAKTASDIKAVEDQLIQMGKDLAGAKSELAEFKANAEEAEKKKQRPGWSSGAEAEQKSLGDAVREWAETENFKSALTAFNAGAPVKDMPQLVVDRKLFAGSGVERKAVTTSDLAMQPARLPGILEIVRRPLRIRDLMTVTPIDRRDFSYVEETGLTATTETAITGIVAAGGVATATVGSAHGLRVNDYLRISGADQAEYNGRITVLDIPSGTTFRFRVAGSPTSPATGTITFLKLTQFGMAAITAEGSARPETAYKLEEVTGKVLECGHWIPMTRAALDDMPELQSRINSSLSYGIDFTAEMKLLYGPGGGSDIQGILTHPRRQQWKWSEGKPGDILQDAVRRAITRVNLTYQEVDAAVLNPLDFEDIEIAKGSDGHYIHMVFVTGGVRTLWTVPLVVTPAILQGEGLVGSFIGNAAIRDRQQTVISFSDQHSDYFTRSMVAIKGECRFGVAWYRPQAFNHVYFDAAPTP